MSTLDTTHECPYLAGYSKDGGTVYIDKRLPKTMKLKDGRDVPVDKYLKVHEDFEKGVEDREGETYQGAHEKATGAERAAVEKDGIPWNEYQNHMLGEVKKLKDLDSKDVPANIDEKPERDSKDTGMEASIKKHQLVEDNHDHFVIRHPDGTDFKVAKNGLSAPMVAHIAKMPGVQHDADGTQPLDDPQAVAASLENAPMAESDPSSPNYNPATVPLMTGSGGDTRFNAASAPIGQIMAPPAPATPAPAPAAQPTGAPTSPPPTTPTGPTTPDMFATFQQQSDAADTAMKGALNAEAAAHGAVGQDVAAASGSLVSSNATEDAAYKTRLQTLQTRGDALYKNVADGTIDPNRMWSSASTGSKIGMLASILVSGLGSGLSGQPNMAMGVINKAIDNDMDAQKQDLGRKQNLLSYNNAQERDLAIAHSQTRADLLNTFKGQLDAAAAKQAGPLAQAHANQIKAQIDMQAASRNQGIAQSRYMMDLAGKAVNGPPTNPGADPDDVDIGRLAQRENPYLPAGTPGQIPADQRGDVAKEVGGFHALKGNLQTVESLYKKMHDNETLYPKLGSAALQSQARTDYEAARSQLKETLTRMEAGRIAEFSTENVDNVLPKFGEGAESYNSKLNMSRDAIKTDAWKANNNFGHLITNQIVPQSHRLLTPSSGSASQFKPNR